MCARVTATSSPTLLRPKGDDVTGAPPACTQPRHDVMNELQIFKAVFLARFISIENGTWGNGKSGLITGVPGFHFTRRKYMYVLRCPSSQICYHFRVTIII